MTPVAWILGRPASGKTTLGRRIVAAIAARGAAATLLDSDEARAAITPSPTYSTEERLTVYRALAWSAARLAEQGVVVVVAATAHEASLRRAVRAIVADVLFVHARCPPELCERRDPKGLYRAARASAHGTMPGVHVPYEEPTDADVVVDTGGSVSDAVVDALVADLLRR